MHRRFPVANSGNSRTAAGLQVILDDEVGRKDKAGALDGQRAQRIAVVGEKPPVYAYDVFLAVAVSKAPRGLLCGVGVDQAIVLREIAGFFGAPFFSR